MGSFTSRPNGADREPARFVLNRERRRYLASIIGTIAVELLGKPVSRTSTELRFENRKLVVNIGGRRAGKWHMFGSEEHGDTLALIQYLTGCDFKSAIEYVFGTPTKAVVLRVAKPAPVAIEHDTSEFSRQTWAEGFDAEGTPGERYLLNRGIPAQVVRTLSDAGVIKFHPAHRSGPEAKHKAPALLLAATDLTGQVHAIQAVRIDTDGRKVAGEWIDSDGKIREIQAKLTCGLMKENCAAGWVSRGTGDVIVAEGPEDAITLYAARPDAMVGATFGSMLRIVDAMPSGRRIILAAQNDDPNSDGAKGFLKAVTMLLDTGHKVWIARPPAGIKDANDLLRAHGIDAVRAMLDAAEPTLPPSNPTPKQPTDADHAHSLPPHWPACTVDAATAYVELQIQMEDWMTQSERWLDARDYAKDQRDAFIHSGMTASEKREAKRNIEREVFRKYPDVNLKRPPRLQLAAAAGLGKSSGLREAYLRHPKLWSRQFHGFLPTVALARGFERDMRKAMVGMTRRPLVALHRGRDHEAEIGNAPCVRWRTGQKLAGKVPSQFSAMCQRGESQCPHYNGCPYIDSYLNQGAGMHLFVHDHLNKSKPLNFPKADFAFIDEDSTQTLLTFSEIGAAVLAEPKTYETAKLTGNQDEAAKLGARLLIAITNGTPMLAGIRADGISRKDITTLAKWATPENNDPGISPSMSDKTIEEIAERIQPHNGDIVGRILRQLASEMRHPRDDAIGVAYHNGVLQLTRHSRVTAVSKGIPLIIIDADADLMTNRRLFGDKMVGREIKARRLGRFVQVKNATLAKSYIAPEVSFKEPSERQVEQAKALRARILEWISTKADGKKVLVVTNKPVRTIFTGEGPGKVPVSVEFGDATWTHYGAILGIDDWKDYDVVVLLGREEMSAGSAERQARAICCNDAEPLLLTGGYRKVTRCHRMRDGSAVPVDVYEHEDPRVQIRTEAKRERGMCQAIDRLRLIHGRADREIFILCNLPLPGVEVDELMSLDDLLAGGTPLQRLIHRARNVWGVLPLVPSFLVENAYDIAPSETTAKRLIAEFKRTKRQLESYLSFGPFKSAKFWLQKQRRPSTVAFFSDTSNGTSIAALERLVGPVTVQISSDTDHQETAFSPSYVAVADEVLVAAEIKIDPAAFEPDEPDISFANRTVHLDTGEGIAELIRYFKFTNAMTGANISRNWPNAVPIGGTLAARNPRSHPTGIERSSRTW